MLSQFPKLFDRFFAIGYLVPGFVLLVSLLFLYDIPIAFDDVDARRIFWSTGIVFALSWLAGIILAACNHSMLRMLEGYYWPLSSISWLRLRKICQWRSIQEKIASLDDRWMSIGKEGKVVPRSLVNERNMLKKKLAKEFPDREDLIMPTGFGNVIRAFEVYPRLMYGLDSIPAWARLLAVVPNDYLELVRSAKANVDLYVNMLCVSTIVFALSFVKFIVNADLWAILYALAAMIVAIGMYFGAKAAAMQWGSLVMACFDTHLPKLAATLGYELPKDPIQRRHFWEEISRGLIYHEPFALDAREHSSPGVGPEQSGRVKVLPASRDSTAGN